MPFTITLRELRRHHWLSKRIQGDRDLGATPTRAPVIRSREMATAAVGADGAQALAAEAGRGVGKSVRFAPTKPK